MRKIFLTFWLFFILTSCIQKPKTVQNLWPSEIERYWVGPQFLSIPSMDWKLDSGRLVCVYPGTNKGVVMLTRQLENPMDGFEVIFEGGFLAGNNRLSTKMGIMLGINEPIDDSYDFTKGFFAGVTAGGDLMMAGESVALNSILVPGEKMIFYLEGVPLENGTLHLIFRVRNEKNDVQIGELIADRMPEEVKGLVSFFVDAPDTESNPVAWFEAMEITGKGVNVYADRVKGPILNISRQQLPNTTLLIVKLAPVQLNNQSMVVLQERGEEEWKTIAKSKISEDYIARFDIPGLNKNHNISFRVYTHYVDRYGTLKYQYVELADE